MNYSSHKLGINIFIASPGDVDEERGIIRDNIRILNEEGYNIKPAFWEDITPDGARPPEETILNKFPPSSWDIFVLVMWSRFGTKTVDPETGDEFDSGTECEYYSALREYEKNKNKRPILLIYRSKKAIPNASDEDFEQYSKVRNFFGKIKKQGMIIEYGDVGEFDKLVFDHIRKVIKEFRDQSVGENNAPVDPLSEDRKQNYFSNFLSTNNNYDLSFKSGLALSNFYIYPNLAGRIPKSQIALPRKHLSEQDILDLNLTHIRRRPSEPFKNILTDVIESSTQLAIVGEPGIGKTTLLKMLGIEAAIARRKIPILIRLSEFGIFLNSNSPSKTSTSLHKFVFESDLISEMFPKLSFLEFIALLDNGSQFILLLDALDEIIDVDLRKQVVISINTFLRRFQKTSVVITMRDIDAIFDCPLKELLPLTPELIKSYVEKWVKEYGSRQLQDLADQVGEDKRLQSLLSNPQMMYMVVRQLVEGKGQPYPNYENRSGLYHSFVEHFLYKRPSGRLAPLYQENLQTKSVVNDLQKDSMLLNRILCKIAYDIHDLRQWYADRGQIIKSIQHAIPKYTETQIGECFRYIVEETGLIVETGSDKWRFSYFPFQQYFAATYFLEHRGYLSGLTFERSMDLWWQDVIVIYYFLSADDKLLLEIINEKDNIFNTLLLLVVRCLCEKGGGSDPNYDFLDDAARKLVKIYHQSPFRMLQETISDHLANLPSDWLFEFIKDEFLNSQREHRLLALKLIGSVQTSKAVEFLRNVYFYQNDLSLTERDNIINAFVDMQFSDSDIVLASLLAQEKEDITRSIIRQMIITNHERYIPKLFQNLPKYPDAFNQILAEVGTAENIHQEDHTIIEEVFRNELEKADHDKDSSRISQILGWIRFAITQEFFQTLYALLDSPNTNILSNFIQLAKFQPETEMVSEKVLEILYDLKTLHPVGFDCLDYLLSKRTKEKNADTEELVIIWLESLPHAFSFEDAIDIYKLLGRYGGQRSFDYLQKQYFISLRGNIHQQNQILEAIVVAKYDITRRSLEISVSEKEDYVRSLLEHLNSPVFFSKDEIIYLVLAFGEVHHIKKLLEIALTNRDIGEKVIISYGISKREVFIPNELSNTYKGVLANAYSSNNDRVILRLLEIEETLVPKDNAVLYQAYIDKILAHENPIVQIEAIKRFNLDKYRTKVLEILREIILSDDQDIRQKAINLISDFGDESSIDVLIPFLADPVFRQDAYFALYEISKRINSFALASLSQSKLMR